jgi:3-dehydrosphinganine reductase
MNNFKNKIVYIVGGSSGIGLATAKLLSNQGSHIIIFSRDQQKLVRAAKEISEQRQDTHQTVTWMQMDVAERSEVDQALGTSVKNHGTPDILINCAGRSYPRHFEDIDYEQFDETMRVNFYGIWHTTKALVPLMKEKGGTIVNVSSLAGFVGVFGFTDYSASKFAIMGFSEALRSELKPFDIKVSVLCPPDTDTPSFEVENLTKPEETRAISENAGLMQPDAVAKALVKGMQKNQPVIIPGFEGKMTCLAKRLVPALVEWTMDRAVRRVRKNN